MNQLESLLEEALDDMEHGGELSQDQIDLIRMACGKAKKVDHEAKEAFDSMFPEVNNFFKGLSAPVSQKI